MNASQMYSSNLTNLLEHFWGKESKAFELRLEDEIMKGCLVVHEGELRSQMLKDARARA
jgi:NAD(P) transhydrogenase subunit alpha